VPDEYWVDEWSRVVGTADLAVSGTTRGGSAAVLVVEVVMEFSR
jgi:hypothetical protein